MKFYLIILVAIFCSTSNTKLYRITSPLPGISVPHCPLANCDTNNSATTQNSLNPMIISNYGTNCSGFFLWTDEATRLDHVIITARLNGTIVVGVDRLLVCPTMETDVTISMDESTANFKWILIPRETQVSPAPLDLNISAPITYKVQNTTLIKVVGCLPRVVGMVEFISSNHDRKEYLMVVPSPPEVQGRATAQNITLHRAIYRYSIGRISAETLCSVEIFPDDTPIVTMVPSLYATIGNTTIMLETILSSAYFSGSSAGVITGINYTSADAPVAYYAFARQKLKSQILPTNLDLLAQSATRGPCYSPLILTRNASGGPSATEDFTVCERMIQWPCSYDSDCVASGMSATCGPSPNGTTGGISYIVSTSTGAPNNSICNFSLTQIINCTLQSMSATHRLRVVGSYNISIYTALALKYSRSSPQVAPSRETYKLDHQCADGCAPLMDTYAQSWCESQCKRKVVLTTIDKTAQPLSIGPGECVYHNGIEWKNARSCSNYCDLNGAESITELQCERLMFQINSTCVNGRFVIGIGSCPLYGLQGCLLGDTLMFGIANLSGQFTSPCASYLAASVVYSAFSTVYAPPGTYIPPRYVKPINSTGAILYDLVFPTFDWKGFFDEMTSGVQRQQYDDAITSYIALLQSLPPGPLGVQDPYWFYYLSDSFLAFTLERSNISVSVTGSVDLYASISAGDNYLRVDARNETALFTACVDGNCQLYNTSGSVTIALSGQYTNTTSCYDANMLSQCGFISICANESIIINLTGYVGSVIVSGIVTISSNTTLNVLKGLSVATGAQLVVGSQSILAIGGNFSLNNSAHLKIGPNASILVYGCIDLGKVTLTGEGTSVIDHNGCVVGNFQEDSCSSRQVQYLQSQIVITFNVDCSQDPDPPWAIIGGVCAGVILVVIVAVLFIRIKALRKCIAPYHYREKYQSPHK